MNLGVVILAGGAGRRIGGSKPERLLAGRALLDHVLGHARSYAETIALAVHREDQLGTAPEMPILLDQAGEGPIAGVGSALRFARAGGLDAVLTLPCDTPFLPRDLAKRLAAELTSPYGAAVATSQGRLHPSCTLWRSSSLSALGAYLAEGRASLKGFAASVGMVAAEWPAVPYDPFFNVNDAADLATAELLLKRR